MLDPKFPDGVRRYWKSLYLDALTDEMIDAIVEHAVAAPVGRDAHVHAPPRRRDGPRPGRRDRVRRPPRAVHAQHRLELDRRGRRRRERRRGRARSGTALEPWSGGRTYFNFPGRNEEGDATLRASYGANYERLVDVKTKWDPDNVFHTGQNIRPRG